MGDQDILEDNDIIEEHDLDPEIVCRVIEKQNQPRETPFVTGVDVAEVFDIPEIDAERLVEQWREPDWPIEYSKEFRVDDVDVYEHFMLYHRGYEPHFAGDLDWIEATWRVDKNDQNARPGEMYSVELIEVNGVDLTDE